MAKKKKPVAAAGYSGTPLVKKLGIKADSILALLNAPPDFQSTLGELPQPLTVRTAARGRRDLTIWFPRDAAELRWRMPMLAQGLQAGAGLWVAWPKKASGVPTDLSDAIVRQTGLENGIVDYKVCAIDETYSGLKFAQRRSS